MELEREDMKEKMNIYEVGNKPSITQSVFYQLYLYTEYHIQIQGKDRGTQRSDELGTAGSGGMARGVCQTGR